MREMQSGIPVTIQSHKRLSDNIDDIRKSCCFMEGFENEIYFLDELVLCGC